MGTPDSRDDYGDTPVHLASLQGHVEMTTLLLDNGADVGRLSQWGFTALVRAAEGGHEDVVALLPT